MMLETTVI